MPDGGLFDGVLARGPVAEQVDDAAWLQALLDAEASLARAEARAGLMSAEEAEAIAAACRPEFFDVAALGAAAAQSGNPVVPLVRALRERVGDPTAEKVHLGATSQDILDTGAMLVAKRALAPLLGDLRACADAAAALAEAHRETPQAGRTLLQQAVPITFGLKAAGWMVALDEASVRLAEVRRDRLAASLGGPAGTLAGMGEAWEEVLAAFASELGLAEPLLPWHTNRTRIAELAGALGESSGVVAKIGGDIVLLAQTEVAEVRERGDKGYGGSSSMPHKHNPVAAVSAVACARQAPGLVATLLAAMDHQHERAAGPWHAEWRPLRELLRSAGAAAAWLGESLERLEVDSDAMAANAERLGPLDDIGASATLVQRALTVRAPIYD